MARKLPPANIGILPPAVTPGDLVAAACGAVAGGAVVTLLQPFPAEAGAWSWAWAWSFGAEAPAAAEVFGWLLALVGSAGFGFFSILLARIDLRTHTLPNGLVGWATGWVFILLTAASIFRGDGWSTVAPVILAVLLGVLALALWAVTRGRFGGGDAKLVPVAAYAAAWGSRGESWLAPPLVFLAVLCGALIVFGVVALIRDSREFAAGPLVLGASWITFAVTAMPNFS